MKKLRRYLLICMKEEATLPEILDSVTQNGGHSKILDYHTHSVAIINTDMMFNKLTKHISKTLENEHYFLIQLKSDTNVMGSIPLRYAKQLFSEDGMDDLIFYNDSPLFDDIHDFNNRLKDAIQGLENSLEHSQYMDDDLPWETNTKPKVPIFSLDEILDKISDKGMGSLTELEIDFLNKQSER